MKDFEFEFQQSLEEGRNPDQVQNEFSLFKHCHRTMGPEFHADFDHLLDRIQKIPQSDSFEFHEPSQLEEILEARPSQTQAEEYEFEGEFLFNRIYGAWLGRCVGCLLGKPVEGWKFGEIQQLLCSSGKTVIDDYLWTLDLDIPGVSGCNNGSLLKFRGGVDSMPEDDDINYTVAALGLIEKYGLEFSSKDVARYWLDNLAILQTFTAERVAYRNFVNKVEPPFSAKFRNPYREWVGAQIRGDLFGYICPGRPEKAASLAWRDASISHVKNGIYSEMWVAGMLAKAFVTNDVTEVIEAGLEQIPEQSRLSNKIRQVLQWWRDGLDYKNGVGQIHARWDDYNLHHWCHALSNAQVVTLALLWSEGNFEQAITMAVYPGFDTDCNGATVGSISGLMNGRNQLPEKWISILNDTANIGLNGFRKVKISDLAKRTVKIVQNKAMMQLKI